MKVLVSTWGNPYQWNPIRYKFKEHEIESRNTLPIMIKALNPDKVLIITLDTMANFMNRNGKPEIQTKEEFNSYEEIRRDTEDRIRWHIEKEVLPELQKQGEDELAGKIGSILKEGKIEIDVAPGVGVFGNITVMGSMLDFYHYITYKLATWLPVNDLEVYLDLTHGINFMPTLTYRALRNLLGLLAYVKDVNFEIMNFEPYPLGVKDKILKETVLNMWEIGEGKVYPKPILSKVENGDWTAFISSVANGFPLVFSTFYPNMSEVKEYLEDEYRKFLSSIKVKRRKEDGKPVVKREESLSKNFKNVSKLYYLLRVLDRDYSKYAKKELEISEIEKITELFKKMPRIEVMVTEQVKDLKNLVKGYYNYESGGPRYKLGLLDLINRKRGKTEEVMKLKKGVPITLLEARNATRIFGPSGTQRYNETPELRNFIAHSGFEYNVTWLKYDGENKKILFFYKDLDTVRELSCKALTFEMGGDGRCTKES